MELPFSRRKAPKKPGYQYDFPKKARQRLIQFPRMLEQNNNEYYLINHHIWNAVEQHILLMEGALNVPTHIKASHAAFHYFQECENDHAFDVIEYMFTFFIDYHHPNEQAERIRKGFNLIFEQENLGYELIARPGIPSGYFFQRYGEEEPGEYLNYQPPLLIPKGGEYLHNEVVRPCLEILSAPEFRNALDELMAAHESNRRGDYADAMLQANVAMESVMKVIHEEKYGSLAPKTDTTAKLADACKDAGLIYAIYTDLLKTTAAIRNQLARSHGKGSANSFPVSREHSDHMIQLVSANITILVKLAGMA